jgi:sec-independent protein translocase protein TatC
MPAKDGLDDTKMSLTDHLTELRARLLISMLAIIGTTVGALAFAPEILDYSIQPLMGVLQDRNRVEVVLIHEDARLGPELASRLDDHPRVRFHGNRRELGDVAELTKERIAENRPIDLIMVSTDAIGDDGALMSDLLEGVEPPPMVVYLVKTKDDPVVAELQLEGATVLLQPIRDPVLKRTVRRAAANAGKLAGGDKLVVLSPLDPFFAYLKIALVVGLFLACPIWLLQAWKFVAPGLYSHEKKVVVPLVAVGSALFLGGGAFAYYAMFPLMFDVIVNQMMPATLASSFTVDSYLTLLLQMTVAFGVIFELPLAIALLAAMGIVTKATLVRFRKYAIVAAFVIGAVLTPADPLSQTFMAVPLVIFYEIGILAAGVLEKRRATADTVERVAEPEGMDNA